METLQTVDLENLEAIQARLRRIGVQMPLPFDDPPFVFEKQGPAVISEQEDDIPF